MRSHPPIFTRLARQRDPYGPVNRLARAIAHSERPITLDTAIRRLWDYQRHPRFPYYRSPGRDDE